MKFLDAVYWPTRIKPDGGRGFMDGSGWATIMLTWFYTLWWFTIADAAKTLIQWVRAPTGDRIHITHHCIRISLALNASKSMVETSC